MIACTECLSLSFHLRNLFRFFVEIMGHCTRTTEAVANEPVHNVDGWQLHFHISYYDGRHDVYSTYPGISVDTAQWAFINLFFRGFLLVACVIRNIFFYLSTLMLPVWLQKSNKPVAMPVWSSMSAVDDSFSGITCNLTSLSLFFLSLYYLNEPEILK